MALWSLWHSNTFSGCILRAVNLLGDADTVGAIAGQLAGAVYGYQRISSEQFGQACLSSLQPWDPLAEIGMRAALLYYQSDGEMAEVEEGVQVELDTLAKMVERGLQEKKAKKDKKDKKGKKQHK